MAISNPVQTVMKAARAGISTGAINVHLNVLEFFDVVPNGTTTPCAG